MAARKRAKKTPPKLTPAEEEKRADQRRLNLDKARAVRLAKQKALLDERVWLIINPMRARRGCKCKLKKGMTWDQLRKLNAGCTSSERGGPGWVCPTLDAYRRHLENPELSK